MTMIGRLKTQLYKTKIMKSDTGSGQLTLGPTKGNFIYANAKAGSTSSAEVNVGIEWNTFRS